MKIIPLEKVDYSDLVKKIKNGALCIFPFDTCYGLVCDPTNQNAVDKLLDYKSRRQGKAISVSVDSFEMAKEFAEVNESAKNFFRNFLPGPFTIIVTSRGKFAKGIEAENGTVGLRIPDYEPIFKLVKTFGLPLTSTSANQSYQKTPYKIDDIFESASPKALELIDFIIDGGELPKNPPSTVIDMSNESIHILRKGSIIPEGAITEEFTSNSEEETIEYARKLMERFSANLNFRPVVFALQGDMGAGKTHFTKGIAASLGIREEINSPTFIISNEYSLEKGNKLYHIDTWRLDLQQGFQELKDLEFEKMFDSISSQFNIISIEWADKIAQYLQKLDVNIKIIWVEILKDESDVNKRVIRFTE